DLEELRGGCVADGVGVGRAGNARVLARVPVRGRIRERRVDRRRPEQDVDAQVLPVGADQAEPVRLGVEGDAGAEVAVEWYGEGADEGRRARRRIDAVEVVAGRESVEASVGRTQVDADEPA